MERTLLIINPISGTGAKQGVAERIKSRLAESGFDVEVKFTTGPGNATELAREAVENKFHTVVAIGGDGTVNETAVGLSKTDVALGIIPAGSGNGLARHLNIPMDIDRAADIIAQRNIVDCDYGEVNHRPFFCTFGVGFDAAVSHRFAKQNRRGKMMYIKSAIDEYLNYNPQEYTISANGKVLTEKAFLIAVCNASQYGNNAYIAPQASITDGLLDFTIVHAGTPADAAAFGIDLMTGYINKNVMIHTFRAPAAVITRNSDGPAHIDGEPLIMDKAMYIQCNHGGIKLYASPKNSDFKPIVTPIKSLFNDFVADINKLFKPI
ncbi:MAG: diacylglycerol kinase family lipid kinase [Bacteroides sp.]|nr:diacylglycerol kinase family lipid kinase [Bacteroides sp.]